MNQQSIWLPVLLAAERLGKTRDEIIEMIDNFEIDSEVIDIGDLKDVEVVDITSISEESNETNQSDPA